MLSRWFEAGGPLMWAVFATWVVVFAGVLDRVLYAAGRARRRPAAQIGALLAAGRAPEARAALAVERRLASRGLGRIDATSQLATSVGLFGTVVGIARTFFAEGADLSLAAPEVLASGLSTALFTTVGGLVVFLFGQAFLIAWEEWCGLCDRDFADLGPAAPGALP